MADPKFRKSYGGNTHPLLPPIRVTKFSVNQEHGKVDLKDWLIWQKFVASRVELKHCMKWENLLKGWFHEFFSFGNKQRESDEKLSYISTAQCGKTQNSLPHIFFPSNQFIAEFFSKTLIWRNFCEKTVVRQ